MNFEMLKNLSDDEANKLMLKVIERLPHNGHRIGSALLEVLEVGIPEGFDPLKFEADILETAFGVISDSYSEDS